MNLFTTRFPERCAEKLFRDSSIIQFSWRQILIQLADHFLSPKRTKLYIVWTNVFGGLNPRPKTSQIFDLKFGSPDALFGIWSNFLEKKTNFDPICAQRNPRRVNAVKYHFLKINTKKNSDSFSWEVRRSLKGTLKIRQNIVCAVSSACEPAPLPLRPKENSCPKGTSTGSNFISSK